jgi:hypothetical protein
MKRAAAVEAVKTLAVSAQSAGPIGAVGIDWRRPAKLPSSGSARATLPDSAATGPPWPVPPPAAAPLR